MKNYLDAQNHYSKTKLKEISNIIKNGGIVIFPTDTVYAIGTNSLDEKAVEKLYNIKQRDFKNPINLLVSNMEMIKNITQDISPIENKLMNAFFPGPFTIILKKQQIVPNIVTANSEFVGVRIPKDDIALKLIEYANIPIAAPSANISGNLSGTNLEDIIDEFSGKVDYIINGGKSNIGFESTIVKVIDEIPHILRPGFITPQQIKDIAGNVIIEDMENELLVSSKMQHYQLETKVIIVYSENTTKMSEKIIEMSKEYNNAIIICYEGHEKYYSNKMSMNCVLSTSFKDLFSTLRKADNSSSDIIIVEGVKEQGLGIAIMNRLLNTCNGNYIEIN